MKEKVITQEEINRCMGYLHSDYHGCTLYLFHSYWDYIKWSIKHKEIDFKRIRNVYRGKTAGMYNSANNYIHLYIFNHERVDKRYIKQCVIHTLLHELRHYYQYKTKPDKWRKLKQASYKFGDPRYSQSPEEVDADKFAARMLKRYRYEISKVLNVYPDWSFTRKI